MTEFISREGVKLAYDTAGSGEPAIVFVHGWACDRTYFAPQFEHFGLRHPVITVDLRGHGDSGKPEARAGIYDIEELRDDVLAVARAAGLDRPVVVGHSLGGLVALACAARVDEVRAAVMVDPGPILNAASLEFFGQAAESIEHDDDGSWRRKFVSGMFLPSDTVRREEIISGMTELAPTIAAELVRAMKRFDGRAALASVAVPLLSIGSAAPSDAAADLLDACPTITVGQTVGSGHFNQLEVPEQVNAMIERFLITSCS
jgi:pimeloyl-ACP methyl ester carboxylesterase